MDRLQYYHRVFQNTIFVHYLHHHSQFVLQFRQTNRIVVTVITIDMVYVITSSTGVFTNEPVMIFVDFSVVFSVAVNTHADSSFSTVRVVGSARIANYTFIYTNTKY